MTDKLDDSIIDLGKGGVQDLGAAVGMPDDIDKENIRRMILRFEKKHPGFIGHAREEARKDLVQNKGWEALDYGEIEKKGGKGITSTTNRTLVFELPEELMNKIEQAYPTMFRDRSHFQWFVKNFRELMVPEKYAPRKGYFHK